MITCQASSRYPALMEESSVSERRVKRESLNCSVAEFPVEGLQQAVRWPPPVLVLPLGPGQVQARAAGVVLALPRALLRPPTCDPDSNPGSQTGTQPGRKQSPLLS